jgi:hypothetical protein
MSSETIIGDTPFCTSFCAIDDFETGLIERCLSSRKSPG